MNKQYVLKVVNRIYITIMTIFVVASAFWLLAIPVHLWNSNRIGLAVDCMFSQSADSFEKGTTYKFLEINNKTLIVKASEVDAALKKCEVTSHYISDYENANQTNDLNIRETASTILSGYNDEETTSMFFLFSGLCIFLFVLKKYLIWLFKE